MIKSEQILSDLVLSKLPKDSMLKALMSPHVTGDILLAMKEIAWQSYKEADKYGDSLDHPTFNEEHSREDFDEWYNKQIHS